MKKIDEKVARISLDKLIENAEAGIISRPAYILNILKDVGELNMPIANAKEEAPVTMSLRDAVLKEVVKGKDKDRLIFYARLIDRMRAHHSFDIRGEYYEDQFR